MLVEAVAGGVLVCGAVAAAGCAVLRRADRPAAALLTLALAAGAASEFGAGIEVVAVVLAFAGTALMVRTRLGWNGLSALDAVMAACAVGALALTAGVDTPRAAAAAAVIAALALGRWRASVGLLCALLGIATLGAGGARAAVAAPALAVAAWLPERRAEPGPAFSPVVLTAVLSYAGAALTLLTVGQFVDIPELASVLATVCVLTGMARAGITVTDRLRASQSQALTDDLTGLGNRRHLLARLGEAITAAGSSDGELALLLIDLDGFKELNDTLGHRAGDEVLRQIGPRLGEALRPGDTLARLGGDEFAVVLAPGDEASASAASLRLRAALERSFSVGGIRVHVDASIGIALFPIHAEDPLGLLQRSDIAMYEAKRTRTGHEVYLPERDHHSRRRLELLGELRDGLDAGELVLHYQPKANIATGEVRGVEALVRWAHPRRGLLMPAEFLPLAEQSGLGRALTAFVVDRALDEIGQRRREGFDLTVAVNLGPADLLDLGLPQEIARLLERRAYPASALQLEVSEDVVMADPARTMEVLAGLREIGVTTSLDDFGAGHASLGYLRELEVDELKIDRSFVMRLKEDDRDAAIVHTTVDLGRRLGMKVVAEGVESADTWDQLARLSCDEAQGFYLGRPMTVTALTGWLRELGGHPAVWPT